jgi:hypothetical protein
MAPAAPLFMQSGPGSGDRLDAHQHQRQVVAGSARALRALLISISVASRGDSALMMAPISRAVR